MKKVLIFSLNYYPRFIGGAEVAIKEITDRIPREEIEFHMITLRFDSNLPRTEWVGNVLVHRIGFTRSNPGIGDLRKFPLHLNKYLYQLIADRVADKLHASHTYDAIWAMMAHSTGIPAGRFKKRHPGVKYLLTLQEGDPPEQIERMMKPVADMFAEGFTRADMLQPISSFLLAWGKRMGFAGDVKVIPNAVDTARFAVQFPVEEIQTERERLGKKEGNFYLVTTSRLAHKNGIDTVIEAMPALPQEVEFLVYGIGPDEEKLRALAERLGVSERVRFMGQIGHADMPRMLAACDVFIRPSRSEGMGNSFIEAMAARLPVIATQEGGIADFLFDEARNPGVPATGWAVDAENPTQIAEAVLDIRSNPEKVSRITTTAYDMVRTRYSWEVVTKEMQEVFRKLLVQ